MHRASWQGRICGAGRRVVLKGQLAAQQAGLGFVQIRQHHGHGLVPPRQAAKVGLAAVVVGPRQVHACEHFAHGGCVHSLRLQLALACQLVDDSSGFSGHGVKDIAIAVGGRVRHGNAAPGQVFHQQQIKRQLRMCQALEQGEHILALIGGGEVIGVFDTAFDAAQGSELAQIQGLQQVVGLGFRDFGEYRHGKRCERQLGLAWVIKRRL